MATLSKWIGLALAASLASCSPKTQDSADAKPRPTKTPLRLGTAPPGGAFHVVGQALAEALTRSSAGASWQPLALPTKGSLDNIEKLTFDQLDFALSNAATTYFAALEGYPVRAVMTLAPNVALFVTRAGSGVETIRDLAGKRVIMGPEGAGFSFFLVPILVAHGVNYQDIRALHSSQQEAVDLLANGQADAAFLGGAVPTDSITRACRALEARFVPYDELPTRVLKREFVFYNTAVIPAGTYPKQEGPFEGLNVGSMQIVASAKLPDETVYRVTRAIYENRERIAEAHPAGKSINATNVVRDTGTRYHPGAVRFYREIGIWPEERTP